MVSELGEALANTLRVAERIMNKYKQARLATRQAEEIKGQADAEATAIYAAAYDRSADSRRFYEFLKTMESYPEVFDEETWVVLSTGGDFYRFLVEGGQ